VPPDTLRLLSQVLALIGRHRRVLMKDVLAYKKAMQVDRRSALDELVKASEEAGASWIRERRSGPVA
jgi:uncharacterized protein YbjQ (UPF0145 family)